MLLQFLDLKEAIEEKIYYDYYIPLNIEWSPFNPPNFYWRPQTKNSLMEMALNPSNGMIRSITLVLFNKIEKDFSLIEKNINSITQIKKGLPAFNVANWPDNSYKDVEIDFKVIFDNDRLYILFTDNYTLSFLVVNYRIVFGFDERNLLCFIGVTNLSLIEIRQLKEAFDRI